MAVCVKCGEVKGIHEVDGKLYCNGCYQLLDRAVRDGSKSVSDEPGLESGPGKESMLLKAAKEELSEDQRKMFDQEYEQNSKSMAATYLLWFLFGFIGIHKFYVRKTGMGVLYIFTGGLFVIGWLIDIFIILTQVRQVNDTIAKDMILKIKMLIKNKTKE